MDKSSASYSQKQSTGRRTRSTQTTTSGIMTPPPNQSMSSPSSSTSQPTETSVSSRYLKITRETVGKFVPINQMSEVFAQLAERFKEEESRDVSVLCENQIGEVPVEEPDTQPPKTSPSPQSRMLLCGATRTTKIFQEHKPDIKGEAEETREPAKENSGEEMREVVYVDETEESKEEVTMSERAKRRELRGIDREELKIMREEMAVLAVAKREAAERKRKGKNIASTDESRKSDPTSWGVATREVATHPTEPAKEEDQHIGAFAWVKEFISHLLRS